MCDGVDERRTPPTVGCRTRETEWGERRRSSAQGQFRGIDSGGTAVREDAARPERVASKVGEAARREAASLLLSGRPARVEAAGRLGAAIPQACGIGRGERRTPTDLFRTKRKTQSVQVSNGRSDQPQPQDQCPTGEGPTSNFNRRTELRTKDQGQLRRFGSSCLRRTNVKLRSGSIPSWETLGLPVQQGSRTQVSMVGNLGKSLTTHPLLPHPEPDVKGFAVQPPKSFDSVHISFHKSSHSSSGNTTRCRAGYRRQSPRVTTRLTLRRSSAFLRALRVS